MSRAVAARDVPPHKLYPGDRPSSILLVPAARSARRSGRLIALYEHKVFAQSVVWGINAFDQWGVELGKKVAERLAPAVAHPEAATDAPPGDRRAAQAPCKVAG